VAYPPTSGLEREKKERPRMIFRSNHRTAHSKGKQCSILSGSRTTPQAISGSDFVREEHRTLNLIAGHKDKISVYWLRACQGVFSGVSLKIKGDVSFQSRPTFPLT